MSKRTPVFIVIATVALFAASSARTPGQDNGSPPENADQQQPQQLAGAPMSTPQHTEQFAQMFLRSMAAGNTLDAFNLMRAAASPVSANEIDVVRESTQRMLDQVRPLWGKPVGYELLTRRPLGASLIRYECLLKLETHPIRCTMFFYKPGETWLPLQVTFEEDMKKLFDELPQ